MATPLLATKFYIPPPRARRVARPRLVERLNLGLTGPLTLISAPAGFGKTTLLAGWIHQGAEAGGAQQPPAVAWLSLDEADNEPTRFLVYLIAALQTVAPEVGRGVLGALAAPQPPPAEAILTTVLNEIAAQPAPLVLVLDDYHVIEAAPVDRAVAFLAEHCPPQLRLIIATRADPPWPLARLRAQGQLVELRAADLRFTLAEAAEFLNPVMDLHLSDPEIAALETRTEGWIAGLQLAAISMRGHPDTAQFIQSFTGSHHFVLDYLVEEVLRQQPEAVQTFLLRTSILDRLCGPLCEAVLAAPPGEGQTTLQAVDRANLFVVPLDNERRWYRYHHLFAELLRQRLRHNAAEAGPPTLEELHQRASQWFEDNRLDLEAFHHAVAAQDIERAARLVEEKGLPLHSPGAMAPVLRWLGALPEAVVRGRPALAATYGSLLLVAGQTQGVEKWLDVAEAGLAGQAVVGPTRHRLGQIASARATLALTRYDVPTMLGQARRALEYLHPNQVVPRATALWSQGYALFLLGDRPAARQSFEEAIAISQAAGRLFTAILATIGLGIVQEVDGQLPTAAETYRRVLHLSGDQPMQIVHEAHLGLARIHYEWNDLDAAEAHGQQSLHLAQQYERGIDRYLLCEMFLARLWLARGRVDDAEAQLAQTEQAARRPEFQHRGPEVAAVQALVRLRQGRLAEAAELAARANQPLSVARVHLAQGNAAAALTALEPLRRQAEAKNWQDEQLRVAVLEAVAHQALGRPGPARRRLRDALTLAEPGGYQRVFIDEGPPVTEMLPGLMAEGGRLKEQIATLLAAAGPPEAGPTSALRPPPALEALSPRELDVLRLMAEGRSNAEISQELYVALSTVKGHVQKIFAKLQVQRRTEAIARARELGLL